MAKKVTSERQIQIMGSLSMKAAAWLLGFRNYQSLSNRVDIPRNDDGSYDAADVLAYLVADAARTKSRMPVDYDDDDAARLLRAKADWEEMRVEKEAGTLIPAERYSQILNRIADAWRETADYFGRQALPVNGREIQKFMNDKIDSLDWSGEVDQ